MKELEREAVSHGVSLLRDLATHLEAAETQARQDLCRREMLHADE